MIVTVTLNPAMDRTLAAPHFAVGQHARARLLGLLPAGKGVNVARGLARLGVRATACGLVGRGEEETYRESLEADGVTCALTPVDGLTRTNTTILDPEAHTATHLREQGFCVSEGDLERLRARVLDVAGTAGPSSAGLLRRSSFGYEGWKATEGRQAGRGTIVFSGSLPPGVGPEEFVGVIRRCGESGARIVVDTSGDALRAAVASRLVHTIKPNLLELGECVGAGVGVRDAAGCAAELLDRVDTVLVTMGEDGAWAVRAGERAGMVCRLEPGRVSSTVGCGDAFLAGWLYGAEMGANLSHALRWAVAAGAAGACFPATVGYRRADVEQLLAQCERL